MATTRASAGPAWSSRASAPTQRRARPAPHGGGSGHDSPVLLDAIALDVPQVPGAGLRAVTRDELHVRFDDDAAGVGSRPEAARRGYGLRRPRRQRAAMSAADKHRD